MLEEYGLCCLQCTNHKLYASKACSKSTVHFQPLCVCIQDGLFEGTQACRRGGKRPIKEQKKVSKSLVKKTKPSLLSVKRQMKEIAEDNMGTNVDVYFEVGCCL